MNIIKTKPTLWLYVGLAIAVGAVVWSLVSEEIQITELKEELNEKISDLEEQLEGVPTVYDADLDKTIDDLDDTTTDELTNASEGLANILSTE
jgi:predicted PurR-regulated permease PerM